MMSLVVANLFFILALASGERFAEGDAAQSNTQASNGFNLEQVNGRFLNTAQTSAADASDVYYVGQMSDRFLGFAAKHQDAMNNFIALEEDRLRDAIANAHTENDKALLETSARATEENRLEAQNAYSQMKNFVTSLKQALGAVGSAASCEDLTCGSHSYCSMDKTTGARCMCKDGYQGNGFICKTPEKFTFHSLSPFRQGARQMQIADVQVSTLQGDTIMTVYRDMNDNHRGYAMLGHASADKMAWHPPVLFSKDSQAYSPVLVQLLEGAEAQKQGGIAIVYRDTNRGGDGILLSGYIERGTGNLILGTPRAFAKQQAQAMAMLPLPDSRVVVFYASHNKDSQQQIQHRGTAMLAQVHRDGSAPEVIGKKSFATGPVARLSATALSPTSFVIAYRQGKPDADSRLAEAACNMGELHDNDLMFGFSPLLLEPEQANIWSRSVSLVAENTVVYTYHSGHEGLTKQSIIKVDPRSHILEVVYGPETIGSGAASVVGSVALIQDSASASKALSKGAQFLSPGEKARVDMSKLLTFFDHDGATPAHARLCNVDKLGNPAGCKQLSWSGRDMVSVSSAQVSDGRYVFIFTDSRGEPFYQFVGLQDPLVD